MELICYPLLSTCSKRAIIRTRKSWGHPVWYNPRKSLILRLSQELNLTNEQVIEQLTREREWLLEYYRYFG